MREFYVRYRDTDTMPDRLERYASDLGIAPEQLIRRFISESMAKVEGSTGPAEPGGSLEDFLVRNCVRKTDR